MKTLLPRRRSALLGCAMICPSPRQLSHPLPPGNPRNCPRGDPEMPRLELVLVDWRDRADSGAQLPADPSALRRLRDAARTARPAPRSRPVESSGMAAHGGQYLTVRVDPLAAATWAHV